MPEPRPVNVDALRAQLPDGWRVEKDSAAVRGFGEIRNSEDSDVGQYFAAFSIHPENDLWMAVWSEWSDSGRAPIVAADGVTGVRERCVAWVVAKVGDAGGG